jgi:hypothetical protein
MTAVEKKAGRLLLAGALSVFCTGRRLAATVTGDTGTWHVVREPGRWRGTCLSRRRCSHIAAMERVTGP